MGKKVPISVENIAFERLDLSRHYLTVDCDFTCFIVLNPSGDIPYEGTDICALHTGAWQIDAWSLLTKKDFPNQAGFIACLVWDRTLVTDTARAPSCVESDIDTANSVSSLKGQPVNITSFTLPAGEALPVSIDSNSVQRSFLFKAGLAVSLETLHLLGAFVQHDQSTEHDLYWFSPTSWRGTVLGNNRYAVNDGHIFFYQMAGGGNLSMYNHVYSRITLDVFEGVLDKILFDGEGCLPPSSTTSAGVARTPFDNVSLLTLYIGRL